mgnify:CR=1 FL=1
MRRRNLIHPGEILLEEFLKPMNISQNKLAMDIHVPAPRINAIDLHGPRAELQNDCSEESAGSPNLRPQSSTAGVRFRPTRPSASGSISRSNRSFG